MIEDQNKKSCYVKKHLLKLTVFGLVAAGVIGGGYFYMNKQQTTPQVIPEHKSALINVTDVKTPKGLSAWLVENHEIPVLSLSIAFKSAGNKNDPEGKLGVCNLLSGMLDEGAGDYSSQDFKKRLLEKNIELSVHQNHDHFMISFRTVKDSIPEAFRLIRLILTCPRFEADALQRVKNQIQISNQQSLQNPRVLAGDTLNSLLYEKHPYGRTTLEELKDLGNITADDLRHYMSSHFTKDRLVISAAGSITSEELTKLIDETFGDLPEKYAGSEIPHVDLHHLGETKTVPLPIPQSVVLFVQKGIQRKDPDFFPVYVMTRILGDGNFESRLWHEVREKRGLAYNIDLSVSWAQCAESLSGATATKNESVENVISIIRKEWKKMIDEGATQEELIFVKDRLKGSFALNFSSTPKIAAALMTYQLDDLGIDYINQRNKILEKVTLEDINRVAKKWLSPEQLTFVIVGNPSNTSPQENSPKKENT